MNIPQIYGLLLEGKKLEIPFASRKDAEGFRVRLQQYKGYQEEQMIAIGMMEIVERQRLSFLVAPVPQQLLPEDPELLPNESFVATIQLAAKLTQKQYEVRILPSDEEESDISS